MTVRVYLPATRQLLRTWLGAGAAGPAPLSGHAVTEEVLASHERPGRQPDADDEALRFDACSDAALAAGDLADAADAGAAVLEVDAAGAVPVGGSAVTVPEPVPLAAWVAAYLAPPHAEVLDAADLGWFGVQELADELGSDAPGVSAPHIVTQTGTQAGDRPRESAVGTESDR